jgi:hypothetical protein
MIPTRILEYSSALAMIQGLKKLFGEGLRPRGMLFMADDGAGHVHLAIPERLKDVNTIKVGNKLSLPWPFVGRMFYLDAVHPIGGDAVVINGDRRLGSVANMIDVAAMVSWFVKEASDASIFFGCTPHQPGSWWVSGERAIALHSRGFVEIVPAEQGLLARRTMDPHLYFLPAEAALSGCELGQFGGLALPEATAAKAIPDCWLPIYASPLGNILMLERRMLFDQLVLSCQEGLVELDLYDLPRVSETGRIPLHGGFAVVGRISAGAFAVTQGRPMDWGFDELGPAVLVGSEGCSFMELRKLLPALDTSALDQTGPFVRLPR